MVASYIALMEDFMFGCFLVLEWYWIWHASNRPCIWLELHMYFTAGLLPLFAFKYDGIFLEDGEKFVLLGLSEV